MAQAFVFVHSTGSGLDAASLKSVRSHVMHRYWRDQYTDVGDENKVGTASEPAYAGQVAAQQIQQISEEQELIEKMAWSSSLSLSASTIDPFASLVLDARHHTAIPHLIHHYVYHCIPFLFPFGIRGRANPIKSIWFPLVVTDAALMQATLYAAAIHYRMVSGNSLGNIGDILRMGAIHLINQRLSNPVDGISDGTIGAVLGLANSERMAGNMDAWETHTSGLERMVQLRGGMYGMRGNPMLPKLIHWADVSASSSSLTYPRFDCGMVLSAPPSILYPESHLSPGFTKLPMHPAARQAMTKIISSMQYISTVLEDFYADDSLTLDPSNYTDAFNAARHRLLSFPFPFHTRPYGTPLVLLSCFGASIYLVSIQPNCEAYDVYCIGVRNWMLKVLISSEMELQENEDLVLWALFMGGMNATIATGRPYFVAEIRTLLLQRDQVHWQMIREVLVRYFWLEIKCANPCRLLFDEAMSPLL